MELQTLQILQIFMECRIIVGNAMQFSKTDIGRADAVVGGMSISSSSGCVSGMGASSSSSDASAMASPWGLDLPREQRATGVQLGAEVLDCASRPVGRRLAPPCFVHGRAFERAVDDGAGTSGARLRPDAALEASEDGHVAGLQVGRALWREEAQYDVRELLLHGGQGGLAGVDAGHVPEKNPRLSFLAWVHHVVQCGRELQERRRRCTAVL